MTDKKKVSILERLLDERDQQIRELQEKNAELEEVIESYRSVDDDMKELKKLIQNGHKLNKEYCKVNLDYNLLKNNFKKDISKVLRNAKRDR